MPSRPRNRGRPARLLLLILVAALAVTSPAAARSTVAVQQAQLRHYSAVWKSLNMRNYRFRIRFGGFPIPGGYRPVTITVRNLRVSTVSPGPVLSGNRDLPLNTIPNLFKELRRVLADPNAGGVTVRYDRHRGFPISASIDPIRQAVDDEFGWTIDRLHAIPPASN